MLFPQNPYHDSTWVKGNPKIGKGTWIGPFCLIDGTTDLTIGEECDISSGTHIYTHSSVRRCIAGSKYTLDGDIDRSAIELAPVTIGNNTFIGPNSTILMGVTIGSRCVIAAGSVVSKDVPDNTIVGGVPAVVLGSVDINANGEVHFHYS